MQDATAMAQLVQSGDARPVELVEEAIQRIESVNPEINAVIVPLFERALAEAEVATGPFRGVPYVLKDMNVAAGVPHASGIAGVKDAGYVSDTDSHFVASMRSAGFVLVGVVNCSEIGMLPTTEPKAWGATHNPWDVTTSTGGSSGGSAAAVASSMVPVAHGSDGGGSTRIPASACGVVGLKPTRGRASTGPAVRYADDVSGNSHEGILTQTVRDAAAVLDAVSGRHTADAYWTAPTATPFVSALAKDPTALRVGVMSSDPMGVGSFDPQIVDAVRRAADTLSSLGHKVEDGHPAALARGGMTGEFGQCFPVVVSRELETFGRLIGRPLTADEVEPFTWQLAEGAPSVTGMQYAAGVDSLRLHSASIQSWWEEDGWDLLVSPVMPILPPKLGEFERLQASGQVFDLAGPMTSLTVAFNVTGQPAISLPLGMSADGMPIGVQLVAAFGKDDLLLQVARQLEEAAPWIVRQPAVHA